MCSVTEICAIQIFLYTYLLTSSYKKTTVLDESYITTTMEI